jgi:hypothetical protein
VSREIEALFAERVPPLARRRGIHALGRLAAWWLRDEVLAEFGQDIRPAQALRPGEFVVLLMRSRASEVVRDGLALPLKWQSAPRDDSRVPRSLAELARRVVAATPSGATVPADLRLHLGEGCPDLSAIDIAPESAGAMLAATLEAARVSAELDARVSATATWGGTDLGPVDGLSIKLATARRIGLERVFVSRFQYPIDALDQDLAQRLDGRNATEQVNTLLLALDAPPRDGSFETRCGWYHRHARNPARRAQSEDFFCSALAVELAERWRREDPSPPPSPDRLVVIASGRAASAVFAACAHRPPEVVVLHEDSPQGVAYAERTEAALARCGLAFRIARWVLPHGTGTRHHRSSDAAEILDAFARDPHDATFVDLTGGTSLMKISLSDTAHRLGMRRFVVDQRDHAEGGTVEVTTLRVIELPPGGYRDRGAVS